VSDRYGLQRHSGGPVARREPGYQPGGAAGHRNPGHGEANGGSDLRKYWEILVRRARTVVSIFVLVVVAVMVGTLLQERVYRATGLLEIRTPSAGISSTDALFSSDRVTATVLGTEQGLLRSPALARRVVSDLDLHRLDAFRREPLLESRGQEPEPGPPASDTISQAELEVAANRLLERLRVHPTPESRLVQVSFDYGEPVMAARIVNAALSSYSDMRLDAGLRAAEWLETQMDSVREELTRSEGRLQAYAEEHGLPYVVDEDLSPRIRERVTRLQDDLAAAEARRYEREALYNLVVQGGDHQAVEDRVVEGLAVRRSELMREYAGISATFTDEYPEAMRLRRQIDEVERLLREERGRIVRVIESEYRLAVRQEEALRSSFAEELGVSEALMRRSGPYHLLRGEVMANRELFGSLQRKRDEARVSAALDGTGVGIVDLAVPPARPHSPKVAYNLALALLAGLVLGVGGAFLREYFDDTVQTGEDLGLLSQVPVLALIPLVESAELLAGSGMGRSSSGNGGGKLLPGGGNGGGAGWSRSRRARSDEVARESLMEAFGMLRTGVLYRMEGPGPRTILVSSCQPGEGKSTICLNLGISLRRVDQSVLIVDADLRRSSMNRTLGIPSRPGLADHLRDGGDWRSLVRSDRDEAGPHILPSGGPVDDAGDLLSLPRMRALLEEAGREYDVVLVDAPALFVNAPDARILSRLVPHVLLVARSGQTPSALFSAVLEATPNALGIAVNGLDVGRLPGSYREFFTPYSDRRLAKGEIRPGSGRPRPAATGAGAGAGAGAGSAGGLLLWLGLGLLLSSPPGVPGGLGPFHL
jgi:polysaccharide biosynthesis transport protein